MDRLDARNSSSLLPEQHRRADAQRLQDLGLTPLGAHQAMHGQQITDPHDRQVLAGVLHSVMSARNSMNI
jgi:hypothetical protein